MMTIRILFAGETWRGPSARSLREALAKLVGVVTDDAGRDHYRPKHRIKALRGLNRLPRTWRLPELERKISIRLLRQSRLGALMASLWHERLIGAGR